MSDNPQMDGLNKLMGSGLPFEAKGWDKAARVCGNCAFWALGSYQASFPGAEPYGAGGHHTDGGVSECRFNAPVERTSDNDSRLSGSGKWPTTKKMDFCGQFKPR